MKEEERRDPGAGAEGIGPDDPSPLLGRWKNVYRLVIIELAVVVALLYALTRWAS